MWTGTRRCWSWCRCKIRYRCRYTYRYPVTTGEHSTAPLGMVAIGCQKFSLIYSQFLFIEHWYVRYYTKQRSISLLWAHLLSSREKGSGGPGCVEACPWHFWDIRRGQGQRNLERELAKGRFRLLPLCVWYHYRKETGAQGQISWALHSGFFKRPKVSASSQRDSAGPLHLACGSWPDTCGSHMLPSGEERSLEVHGLPGQGFVLNSTKF